ncbi:site-specific recombinase XerD [freshwater metagenome]|uniref:Site-specific recombinase XerD n=1 Tax=freshwater metagenome TaxID=449393 RepID=A0A094Q7F2_9ZZZZ
MQLRKLTVMNIQQSVNSFLDHLRIERGLAANSIAAYQRDLRKLVEFFVSSNTDTGAVLAADIAAFESSLKTLDLAPASINRIMSAVRTFYKYQNREFGITDPTTEIAHNKSARRLPKALTVSEVTSLINAGLREGDVISLRDHAMLELLYSSGARVSEVIGINLSDFAKSNLNGEEITTLKVRGKGGKERIVPLGKFAVVAIDNYLVRIRPTLAAKSGRKESSINGALFLNQKGTRISRQSAWQIVLTAAERAGITSKVSPHVFRHSYATHLLDGGADIRVVQELLGHASVTTTQIYTLITIDKIRESYISAHPRAR